MAKQSGGGAETLVLPHDTKNRARGGSFGRTEGSKVSSLLGKYKESTQAAAAVGVSSGQSPVGRFASKENESQWMKQLEEQAAWVKEEEEEAVEDQTAPHGAADGVDFEKEIESTLKVTDLVDIPLSNNADVAENEEVTEDVTESIEDGNRIENHEEVEGQDLADKNVVALEQEEHQEQLEQATEAADRDLQA
ncbi:hypothetical protein EMPS_03243 [Entomortierella parvispora]|uniref:Uncharacterized protein n=1 Tax=Entomortierella parvispora TaxID=205924 RepID=A0A9P3H6E8_9FUNG|nr:hypothetical protein EMPS_03243 [Entomortierella parvispora]